MSTIIVFSVMLEAKMFENPKPYLFFVVIINFVFGKQLILISLFETWWESIELLLHFNVGNTFVYD